MALWDSDAGCHACLGCLQGFDLPDRSWNRLGYDAYGIGFVNVDANGVPCPNNLGRTATREDIVSHLAGHVTPILLDLCEAFGDGWERRRVEVVIDNAQHQLFTDADFVYGEHMRSEPEQDEPRPGYVASQLDSFIDKLEAVMNNPDLAKVLRRVRSAREVAHQLSDGLLCDIEEAVSDIVGDLTVAVEYYDATFAHRNLPDGSDLAFALETATELEEDRILADALGDEEDEDDEDDAPACEHCGTVGEYPPATAIVTFQLSDEREVEVALCADCVEAAVWEEPSLLIDEPRVTSWEANPYGETMYVRDAPKPSNLPRNSCGQVALSALLDVPFADVVGVLGKGWTNRNRLIHAIRTLGGRVACMLVEPDSPETLIGWALRQPVSLARFLLLVRWPTYYGTPGNGKAVEQEHALAFVAGPVPMLFDNSLLRSVTLPQAGLLNAPPSAKLYFAARVE